MSIKEAEFIGKQFQQKIVGPDSLSGEYYHIVKEEINSTQIHKKWKRRMQPCLRRLVKYKIGSDKEQHTQMSPYKFLPTCPTCRCHMQENVTVQLTKFLLCIYFN